MRIAIFANTSWNILNFRLGLIHHLQSLDHQLYFIAPFDEFTKEIELQSHAIFIPVTNLNRKGLNPMKELLLYREIKSVYKKYNIDLSINYTIKPNVYGAIACHALNIKCISNVTGLGFVFIKESFQNSLIIRFFKYALNKSQLVVFQNDVDKDVFISNKILPIEKVRMIYGSGINSNKFNPAKRENAKPFTFLFLGRLLYDKGILELLDAFDQLCLSCQNVSLHLVGEIDEDNPSAFDLNQLNDRLDSNHQIVFFGKQSDVSRFIANCDCVVLPSYREGLPKSLLEAMSMAKPIITTNTPGCSQLIHQEQNGFLCQAKSSQSLCHAMKKMLQLSTQERNNMGLYGRKLVELKYDEKIIVRQYEKIILELM